MAGRVCRAHTASSHRAHPSAGPLAQAPRCAPTVKNHLFQGVPYLDYFLGTSFNYMKYDNRESYFYYDVALIDGDLTGSKSKNA